MMGDRYEVTANGSVVAVGRNSTASGSVQGVAVDADALRAQLARLEQKLADMPSSRETGTAEARLADMCEVVDSAPTDGPEIRQRWDRLRAALAAISTVGVTGATAFGADVAQIATTVATAW